MSNVDPTIPAPVARVEALMAGFKPRWALCGGWAVDAINGHQTREHSDVDIVTLHEDQRALREHLTGWDLVAHDDNWLGTNPIWPNVPIPREEIWDGRAIELPGHLHIRSTDGFDFEVNLVERDGADWVFSREPDFRLPFERCIGTSAWRLPAVSAEVLIYYKALQPLWRDEQRKPPRPHDELDFAALLPRLDASQREWLVGAIGAVEATHPWLERLRAAR